MSLKSAHLRSMAQELLSLLSEFAQNIQISHDPDYSLPQSTGSLFFQKMEFFSQWSSAPLFSPSKSPRTVGMFTADFASLLKPTTTSSCLRSIRYATGTSCYRYHFPTLPGLISIDRKDDNHKDYGVRRPPKTTRTGSMYSEDKRKK